MPFRNLNVLDAAEQAAKQVNELIDRSKRPPLLHVTQLRDYWPLHNRYVVIVKMLNSLLNG